MFPCGACWISVSEGVPGVETRSFESSMLSGCPSLSKPCRNMLSPVPPILPRLTLYSGSEISMILTTLSYLLLKNEKNEPFLGLLYARGAGSCLPNYGSVALEKSSWLRMAALDSMSRFLCFDNISPDSCFANLSFSLIYGKAV